MFILSFNIYITGCKSMISRLFNIPTHFFIFQTYRHTTCMITLWLESREGYLHFRNPSQTFFFFLGGWEGESKCLPIPVFPPCSGHKNGAPFTYFGVVSNLGKNPLWQGEENLSKKLLNTPPYLLHCFVLVNRQA